MKHEFDFEKYKCNHCGMEISFVINEVLKLRKDDSSLELEQCEKIIYARKEFHCLTIEQYQVKEIIE